MVETSSSSYDDLIHEILHGCDLLDAIRIPADRLEELDETALAECLRGAADRIQHLTYMVLKMGGELEKRAGEDVLTWTGRPLREVFSKLIHGAVAVQLGSPSVPSPNPPMPPGPAPGP